jgi:hypothetical protein
MKPTVRERFVKLVHTEQGAVLMDLLKQRKLLPRDIAVFTALAFAADTKTGRIHATADAVAEQMGLKPPCVRSCFSRLKAQHVLRLIHDKRTGARFYLLNPWMLRAGTPANEGMAMRQFQEA